MYNKPMSHRCLALRLPLLCLFGLCALWAAPKEKKGAAPPASGAAATKASTGASTIDPKNFVIGAEDILQIQVWRDPDVSRQVMVRPDGKITLQLLGEIQAAGLTPEALTQVIYDGLLKLKTLDKSEVTVTVMQVNSRKYFVTGEVNRSGSYPLLVPTTVLEALVNAGGFREFANLKKIKVMRKGTVYHFNYKEVIAGKKLEQNILLEPGDQIFVP
jgi:polysaccharide biosynthesis/export protein